MDQQINRIKMLTYVRNKCKVINVTIKQMWHELKPKDKRYFKVSLWTLLIIGALSIFIVPWLFTLSAPASWMRYNSDSANVANTIYGLSAPLIAIVAAFLTFLAFWIQYQANVQQREIFNTELHNQKEELKRREDTWKIERFEGRFYELLKLHKANVDEINVGNRVSGRKAFMPMFYEFRFIYKLTEIILYQNEKMKPKSSEFHLLSFAYKIFFFGIGPNSEKNFVHYLKTEEVELFKLVKTHLSKIQDSYKERIQRPPKQNYYKFNTPIASEDDDFTFSAYYYPFDGHVTQLGHYYRHLFQVGKYIIAQPFIESDKYSYIKILRAQLSDFEQLMLYYNSLAWFPNEWKQLFVDYRLIKNLPLPLADFDDIPESYFANDIDKLFKERGVHMFEWNES